MKRRAHVPAGSAGAIGVEPLRPRANGLRSDGDEWGKTARFFDTSRRTPPGNSACADPAPRLESSSMPTRSVSEGAGVAPQLTCGIPRSRFGLVWLVPFDQVVISEESRGMSPSRRPPPLVSGDQSV